MGTQRVLVIGAGAGGLAAAVLLAARGVDVLVLEAAATPGGKLREVQVAGQPQDAGPTVFTMRWVLEQLFADAGASLQELLPMQPVDTLARHAWEDGSRLDLFADLQRSEEAIAALAGPQEAQRYRAFSARARGIYQLLEQSFMCRPRPNPVSLAHRVGWRRLPELAAISPFRTLWAALGECFQDPRLRQLFGRYATYCGSSPFQAPATLMLVAHAEQAGVWTVDGGMHRIATTLAALLERLGGRIRYASPVTRLQLRGDQVCGATLADGETLDCAAAIFNGDTAALAQGLLGDAAARAVPPTAIDARSLSALTWNLVTPAAGFPLARHTVFFSRDYAAEFDSIQRDGLLPGDPTVYLCAHDRDGSGQRTQTGAERLMCLVNAPARADRQPLSPGDIAACQERMFAKLARCGLRLYADPESTVLTTPAEFQRLFPATGGALYGRASHGWRASFSRPGARSAVRGLYLAGGSVHPGPGVPMAMLSGRIAAGSLVQDMERGRLRGRP
ncbi:MAG: phytoene desaturase family protein [Rhodoferax sp.]